MNFKQLADILDNSKGKSLNELVSELSKFGKVTVKPERKKRRPKKGI